MRISCLAALAGLGFSACTAPLPPPSLAPNAVRAVAEACADLEQVDLARLPRQMPDWSSIEAFHRMARGASDQIPAMGAAGTVLVLSSPGGSISAPYGIGVWAARSADRSWRVSHLRILQLPPPPQPPGTPSLRQPPERILMTGQLKPDGAQRIEAALASDCLAREPFASPTPLPMKNGPDLHCPPDGGGTDALEIRDRGRSRRYLRECGSPWAPGSIIIALENPENLQPD